MRKLTSRPFSRVAKEAKNEALVFWQDKHFEFCDTTFFKLLHDRTEGHFYALSDQLSNSANYHGRIAFGAVLGEQEYTVNLVDCWVARCLAAKFREQEWINGAGKSVPGQQILETYSVRLGPTEIHTLAFATCNLYSAGHESCAQDMTPLFELYDMRQDVTHHANPDELEAYDVSICVSLIVGRGNPDMERILRLLSPIPVFEGVDQFWLDDDAFARFTERAAQWHFDYSNKNMDKFKSFAKASADILNPCWVLALDAFRQKHFGRPSCLGTHELLDLGKDVIALAKSQHHPKHEVFAAAEKFYIEQFGNISFNPVPFWEKVMGV